MPLLSRPIYEVIPVELMIQVLDEVSVRKGAGFSDIVRLSRVDKATRAIILSRSRYWAEITVCSRPCSVPFAKKCIERSKNAPITLDVIFNRGTGSFPPHLEGVVEVLSASAPRIKVLTIVMDSYPLLRSLRSPLRTLEMPKLEILVLDTSFRNSPDRDFSLPSSAPILRSLALQGVVPNPLELRSFAKLTCIRIATNAYFDWPADSLALIIHHAAALEELYFEGEEDILTADAFEWTYALHCPRLRYLSILNADTPFVVQVLINLQAPVLETVRFAESSQGDLNSQDEGIKCDELEMPTHSSVRTLMAYSGVSYGEAEEQREAFLSFLAGCFPNIVTLEIDRLMTKILNVRESSSEDDLWRYLENLKVVGGEGGVSHALEDVLRFVNNRSQRPACHQIKDLKFDARSIKNTDGQELMEELRGEVETVQFGTVQKTPWKRSPYE